MLGRPGLGTQMRWALLGLLAAAGVPTGKIPRSFAIDPTGKYLVVGSQMSNNIAVFAIGQKDGLLKQTGQPLDISAPVVISFVPAE
jgi:6-phosphogluconolactonase (cycloisomerase 2 family)